RPAYPHGRTGDQLHATGQGLAAERALLLDLLAPPAPLSARADVALKFLLDRRDAGVEMVENPPGPRSWIESERGKQVLGADVALPGPPRKACSPGQRLPGFLRLRWRGRGRLPDGRKQLARGMADRLDPDSQPFEDGRSGAFLEQPGELVVRAH